MRNIISIGLNRLLRTNTQSVLLFDSIAAAYDIAFMLKGQWDNCNGVVISKFDEVAVNTAASLMQTTWCYQGATVAVLTRLIPEELLRRYAIGERNFINANLRCAEFSNVYLTEVNFSRAKLSLANLSGVNLSKADLTGADIQNANLSHTNLSQSRLVRANLADAKLTGANLKRADLSHANLTKADLTGAILDEANFIGADLSGALF
jgi:uncharacterized protein YjbI with pentapeptide repeats